MHTLYVIGVMVIIPTICVIVDLLRKPQQDIIFLFCKWYVFWAVGVRGFTAGLMQAFNPSYTANLLQVTTDNYLIIQELGFANIGIGTLGICSIIYQDFRKPAVLCDAIFLVGAAALHITRITIIDFSELMSLVGDIFTVIIAILVFVTDNKKTVIKK